MSGLEYRSLREIKNIDQLLALQSNICKVGLLKYTRPKRYVYETYTESYVKFLEDIEKEDNLIKPMTRAINGEYNFHPEMLALVVNPLRDNLLIVLNAELKRREYTKNVINSNFDNVIDVLADADVDLLDRFMQLTKIIGHRLSEYNYSTIQKYIAYTTSIYKNRF